MIDDWWCYYIYICYYCYEHSTVWTIAFFTSWCCCCGGMPLLHWHDRNHWRLFPYVVGLFALRCLDEAFQGAKRKWTLSPKFIGHHPGSVFFQNAELKQIWSDQTNPTYTNMFSNLVDASPHFGRRGLCRRWHQKKPSAMSPLLQWPQPSNFRTAELIEGNVHCKNHRLLEILHEIYSPDHHWIPGNLTFSIFIKNPSAHSCHPVSLTIVLFNISANPHALNI